MKKLFVIAFLFVLINKSNAQGLFNLGSQDLGKKKIEKIELKLLNPENLSPASEFLFGIIAYDKKKSYSTIALDGDYWIDRSYKIEISNGSYEPYSNTIKINSFDQLSSNEIKIKASLLSNPNIFDEKVLTINYKGKGVANFSGKSGSNGTNGKTSYIVGARGGDGSNDAQSGGNGQNVSASAKLVDYNSSKMILVKLISSASNSQNYYMIDANLGQFVINVSGGYGGRGGWGASGTYGNKEKFIDGGNGGNGGDGADGGNGGNIKMVFDKNMKGFENKIILMNNGGSGGEAGLGGSGGSGYRDGRKGISGRSGRNGMPGMPAEISYADLDLELPNK